MTTKGSLHLWRDKPRQDMHITYCTTLAVESMLTNTSIPENVILGNVREMTKEDDAILQEAADTTAKQFADGWLTWANTQQPPTTSQAPENTEKKHCDLVSCAPKQWQLQSKQKKWKLLVSTHPYCLLSVMPYQNLTVRVPSFLQYKNLCVTLTHLLTLML